MARVRSFYLERVPLLLIASGAVLRVEQYLHRRSLWLDEALVAQAIHVPLSEIGHGPGGLAIPVGFGLVERLAVSLFGNNEYALRLFPLVCGIASLVVFRSLARRLLSSAAVPVALALFCFSPSLLYFSGEVKQYASDVLFALLIIIGALRLRESERISIGRAIGYGSLGAAAVWFSHPAAFVLAGVTAVLIVERAWGARRNEVLTLSIGSLVWAASLLATYLVSLRLLTRNQNLLAYWRDGFPPRPLRLGSAMSWLIDRPADVLRYPAGFHMPKLAALAATAGAVAFLMRRRAVELALLLVPVPILLAAATARKYPARDRLVLFLIPAVFLLVAGSVDLGSVRRFRLAGATLLVMIAFVAVEPVGDALTHFVRPIERTETRQVFEYVRDHWRRGDKLYVEYGALPAYRYYAAIVGVSADRVVLIERAETCDDRSLLADVGTASRVWLVFGDRRLQAPANYRPAIVSHFAVVARPVLTDFEPGAAATLFDSAGPPLDAAGNGVIRDPAPTCVRLLPLLGAA